MTPSGWLACTDVLEMLRQVGVGPGGLYEEFKPTPRILHLFSCACLREQWGWLTAEEERHAVGVAERRVDGLASGVEITSAQDAMDALAAVRRLDAEATGGRAETGAAFPHAAAFLVAAGRRAGLGTAVVERRRAAVRNAAYAILASPERAVEAVLDAIRTLGPSTPAECRIVRDLIGPNVPLNYLPFRDPYADHAAVVWEEHWRTEDVRGVATAIYEDGRFGEVGHLADALNDAGCGDEHDCNVCGGSGAVGRHRDRQCHRCRGLKRLPHAMIAHLRETVPCPGCTPRPADTLVGIRTPWVRGDGTPCPRCGDTRKVPAPHYRGCWVVDFLRNEHESGLADRPRPVGKNTARRVGKRA